MYKTLWKKVHNWFGISSALFLTLLLVTGVLLNHPGFLKSDSFEVVRIDPSNPMKFYSGKKEGLFFSNDQGKTWEEVPMLYPPQEVVDIAFAPDSPRIYVLEKWGKIFLSNDGGKIWQSLTLPFDPQARGIELKKISAGRKDQLLVLTSNGWLTRTEGNWNTSNMQEKIPYHRLVLTLHNGYFFGPGFVWVFDFSAVALLILIVTGLYLWKIGRTVV